MTNTDSERVFPLGKKFMRLGAMDYTSKKGTAVKAYGLEEVRAVPDGNGGITFERAFQGTRLQTTSPDELRAFLLQVGQALNEAHPPKRGNGSLGKPASQVTPLTA